MKILRITKWALLSAFILLVALIAFCEANKAYWDHRVKEMCSKDGDVKVFEKIEITEDEYVRLPKYDNKYVAIMEKSLARPDQIVFSDKSETVIKKSSPSVIKTDFYIKRIYGGKVVAQYSIFRRSGGDIPIGFHPSTFICPNPEKLIVEVNNIFTVKDE